MSTLVITGTDTEIGKTHVACHLLRSGAALGWRSAGYKPVAAGATPTPKGLRNDDALALQAAGNVALDYEQINPYCFAPAIAPHLAAEQAGVRVTAERLSAGHDEVAAKADWVVLEGAGGWRVPLGSGFEFADWVGQSGWPVLLVVGMRLGCLNHAMLSAESIIARTRLVGWVANCLPPEQSCLVENIHSLVERMPVPLWGVFPSGGGMAEGLDLREHISGL